jgi:hypothetical protein
VTNLRVLFINCICNDRILPHAHDSDILHPALDAVNPMLSADSNMGIAVFGGTGIVLPSIFLRL